MQKEIIKTNKTRFLSILLVGLMMAFSFTMAVMSLDAAAQADSPTVWKGNIATKFADGDGTSEATAYEISSGAELAYLAQQVNAGNATYNASGIYYKLTDNIILNDLSLVNVWGEGLAPKNKWTAIGNSTNKFLANFDGDNKTMQGIYINKSDGYQGLFGYVDGGSAYVGGTIKNVGVEKSYIKGKGYVGGIAGYVDRSEITNCYNIGSVTGTANNVGGVAGYVDRSEITNCYNTGVVAGADNYVGGVAGNINSSNITNCYNTGNITGSATVGGIAGNVFINNNITNCYNIGSVTNTGSGNVGGIAGYVNSNSIVINSYNAGNVTGSGIVGGVVGFVQGSSVTYCYMLSGTRGSAFGAVNNSTSQAAVFDANGKITVNPAGNASAIPTTVVGTITPNTTTLFSVLEAWRTHTDGGNNDSRYIAWLNTPSYPTLDLPSTGGGSIGGGIWGGITDIAIKFADGDGSEQNPYQIESGAELALLAGLINKSVNTYDGTTLFTDATDGVESDYSDFNASGVFYKLTNDIVLNDTAANGGWANWGNSGTGLNAWTAIGNNTDKFLANFDGNNKTIKGVYINKSDGYQGLFGYVDGGTIKNAGVEKSYIKGTNYVGGIAGYGNTNSTITNCYNTGSVEGSGYSIGGVAGYVFSNSTITNCYNTGSVKGNQWVGGVAGFVKSSSTVSNCYNTGSVNGDSTVGGVAGDVDDNSTISNCYNTGSVDASSYTVGGIAGYVYSSSLTNCYNTGSVTSGGLKGGIVSSIAGSSSATYCYYLKTTTVNNFSAVANVGGGTASDCLSFDTSGNFAGNTTDSVIIAGNDYTSLIDALNAYISNNHYSDAVLLHRFEQTGNTAEGAIKYRFVQIMTNTVTFNTDGGSTVSPASIFDGDKVIVPSSAPTKSGFAFAGWFTSTDGGTTLSATAFDFDTIIFGDMALYAKWLAKTYSYTVTANGLNFDAVGEYADDSTYVVSTNSTIQAVINAIREDANGNACTIFFGNGETALNIGASALTLTGFSGTVTLTGSVTSTNLTSAEGTVVIDGVSVVSSADIGNTYAGSNSRAVHIKNGGSFNISGGTVSATESQGKAIYNNGTGNITISGGTVSATTGDAISNWSSGAVTISGGTVQVTTGYAIYNNFTGTVTISGGTVQVTGSSGYAIYNAWSSAINISGGTVQVTGSSGYAIYNYKADGTIVLGGDPTVTGRISVYAGKMSVNASGTNIFAPVSKTYTIELSTALNNAVVVVNGANVGGTSYLTSFAIVNSGYVLRESGNNIVAISTYTVTFKDGNGDTLKTEVVSPGGAATAPEGTPTKSSTNTLVYTFTGWDVSFNNITSNLMVTAQFSSATRYYTVIFYDENGTTALDTQSLEYNAVITYGGNTPQKASTNTQNFVFNEWSNSFVDGTTTVSGDGMTFTASYTANTRYYTVNYSLNGGNGTVPENITNAQYNTVIALAPTLDTWTKAGYSHDGKWYTRTGAGTDGDPYVYTEFVFGASGTAVTASVTLYLRWTAIVVTFDPANGGSTSTATANTTDGKVAAPLPAPTKTGYVFSGWFAAESGGTAIDFSDYVPTASTTLYAQWSRIVVTFDIDGSTSTVDADTTTGKVGKDSPTKTGYTFSGWFAAASGGNAIDLSTYVPTASATLYAQWTIAAPVIASDSGIIDATYGDTNNKTLSVTVAPITSITFSYQWYKKDGGGVYQAISDATNASLARSNVIDSGDYKVVITASDGSQTSTATEREFTVAIANGSQNAPTLNASTITSDSIVLTQVSGAEYKIEDGTWQASNIFTGLNASTEYTFYIRMKATANLNESAQTTGTFTTSAATVPPLEETTYEISGEVTDANDEAVAGALVYIVKGRDFFGSAVTDDNGGFTITNLPDGVYNVVALFDGKTATVAVTVSGGNASVTIKIYDLNVSSKLDVKEGAPNVVVGGLDEIAGANDFLTNDEKSSLSSDGGSAELKLTVEASSTVVTAEQGKTIGFVVDITVTKTILDASGVVLSQYNLPSLSGLISVIIPLDEAFRGKQNYVVYRMHGDELQILTTIANIDGEYFMLTADGKYIVVYTKNFSSYAIGFDEDATSGGETPDENNCFVHWIMLALMLLYIAFALVLFFVFGKKNHLSQYIGWGAYLLGIIITACFMKWDALCVVFFILAVLAALAALFYWLINFNPTVKDWIGAIKQKLGKQDKNEQTDETEVINELHLADEENTDGGDSETEIDAETEAIAATEEQAELLELVEEEELTETDIAEILSVDESDDAENDGEADAISTIEKQIADGGEIVIDEETKQLLAEAAIQRQAFVEAKKAGAAISVPSLTFTLSREDVLDYIEDMAALSDKFPVNPNAKQKSKKHYCDTLYCGDWCFGLMYERSNVIKMTLRMDEAFASEVDKSRTAFKSALFPKGEGWYDLVVDSSFVSKKEVYEIIDACYDYVFKRYYHKEEEVFVTDTAAAKTDAQEVLDEVKDNATAADPAFDLAIAEREEALKKFRAENQITFKMTRKRMLIFAKNNKELKDGGVVIERQKRHMPCSLKAGGKTYAMVYEKAYKGVNPDGTEAIKVYVTLTIRLSDIYAEWLALRHPEVCRARFPKNRNWYIVPVDGSFPKAQMVYRVLKRAKKFVTK